jgi:uncharacterized protein (UPF0332 family)
MSSDDVRLLVALRLQNAEESLADARILQAGGGSGRSVVNRAYYSMFYCVLALLQTIGRVPRKHQGAISLFDAEFVHKGLLPRELSAELHAAFVARQADDYRVTEPVSVEDARAAIDAASQFLDAVRGYLNNCSPSS